MNGTAGRRARGNRPPGGRAHDGIRVQVMTSWPCGPGLDEKKNAFFESPHDHTLAPNAAHAQACPSLCLLHRLHGTRI